MFFFSNCLFRALGDQLEGHSRNHFRHRQEVVQYMMEHRKDFEPFVEDDLPFDVHSEQLMIFHTFLLVTRSYKQEYCRKEHNIPDSLSALLFLCCCYSQHQFQLHLCHLKFSSKAHSYFALSSPLNLMLFFTQTSLKLSPLQQFLNSFHCHFRQVSWE